MLLYYESFQFLVPEMLIVEESFELDLTFLFNFHSNGASTIEGKIILGFT